MPSRFQYDRLCIKNSHDAGTISNQLVQRLNSNCFHHPLNRNEIIPCARAQSQLVGTFGTLCVNGDTQTMWMRGKPFRIAFSNKSRGNRYTKSIPTSVCWISVDNFHHVELCCTRDGGECSQATHEWLRFASKQPPTTLSSSSSWGEMPHVVLRAYGVQCGRLSTFGAVRPNEIKCRWKWSEQCGLTGCHCR